MTQNFIILILALQPILTNAQESFMLVAKKSTVGWQCDYVLGKGHEGSILVSKGVLIVDGTGVVTKGDFTIDMKSIIATDPNDERARRDLQDHLVSQDFLDASVYPDGQFSIINATPVAEGANQFRVRGFLTIKGITHQIEFPAVIVIAGTKATATADLVIDRTKWGIVYQSGSIFTNLKDGVISDLIKIRVDLHFAKGN